MFKENKLIKILALTLVLSLGIGAVVVLSPMVKAKSEVKKAVAYVDFGKLLKNHPKRDEVDAEFNQYYQNLKEELGSELQSKLEETSGDERQKLLQNYNQRLNEQVKQRQAELLQPLKEDIDATIKKVAAKEEVAVVLHKESVVYGGNDLTDKVLKAMEEQTESN
ncbi:OmpH family outer membrane protein [Acetohalobium arabaticum]|uniref:Outer membrane chaperone Skp (OmpH) n=1 Tax=Acetohalobium arabaticum (strain ATCC 49924 / DSM 5501 / Z-7288) TaxID=574087 RepID=D9QTW5_ACEAZ|nr:OmpH family outer membrane protein [Acetohalobium arabaticum]ADL13686.1 outer membrane chaperone Skp (OmpH) [Acetohalobium arabaticum DSM 5501]